VPVQIALADGTRHSAILRRGSPSLTVPARATGWEVAGAHWLMGAIHILQGIGHLLFVLVLMLLVSGYWMLFKTIIALTVSHSIKPRAGDPRFRRHAAETHGSNHRAQHAVPGGGDRPCPPGATQSPPRRIAKWRPPEPLPFVPPQQLALA
jgi:hypothetical protein